MSEGKRKYVECKYVDDADGGTWEYRRVSSVLERRNITSAIWQQVMPSDFAHMTAAELRRVADVLEGEAQR